jgi:hypothetical protein
MARDKIHTPVKEALIQEGWNVTDDPLYIKIGNLTVFVDLGERWRKNSCRSKNI